MNELVEIKNLTGMGSLWVGIPVVNAVDFSEEFSCCPRIDSINRENYVAFRLDMSKSKSQPQAWLLLTFGDQRQYAGNQGYEDDPQNIYHYDSFVPNHKQISEGDVAVIRDTDKLVGIARIERISSQNGQKLRLRCPECNAVKIQKRKNVRPTFRCKNKHIFETPIEQIVECIHYKAFFGESFISTPGAVTIDHLRKACLRASDQLSMQAINMQMIANALILAAPNTQKLIEIVVSSGEYLSAEDADQLLETPFTEGSSYIPTDEDHRDRIQRIIRARRGQQAFRQSLIARYGPLCMVTGCELLDIIEAAHISPYRGLNDHHVENGLLLRADIHVLFDLDLMGIEPESLIFRFHPVALKAGYQNWDGQKLNCKLNPSIEALKMRWLLFNKRKEIL